MNRAILLWGMLCCTTAQAAPFYAPTFEVPLDAKGLITLDGTRALRWRDLSVGLAIGYGYRHLVQRDVIIKHAVAGQISAAFGVSHGFQLGVGLPLAFWDGANGSAQGVGDLRIGAKWSAIAVSRYPVGLALALDLSLPTGSIDTHLGTGRVGLSPRVIAQAGIHRRLHLFAQVGVTAQLSGQRRFELADKRLRHGHRLTYGAGASFALAEQRVALLLEFRGSTDLVAPFASDRVSPQEVTGALRFYLASRSFLTLGLGRGLRGERVARGAPSVRGFASFVFEPRIGDRDGDGIADDVDKCPTVAEDFDDFLDRDGCPEPDNDRDQILDEDDRCPNEPEDRDGVADDDGCPESDVLDRDGDGIPDLRDRCPDDPEDKDGFEDQDGCPDPDNDRDGVLDIDDLCPNKPEDKDGFEDKDGCPDPDNDRDRILDSDDKCPNQPENYNGYRDQDGCPDPNPAIRRRGTLVPLGKIYFETDRATIRPVSFPVLDSVGAAMDKNPSIRLLEVQGHADERGGDAYNMALTQRRAAAVVRYLRRYGVAAKRLRAKGYGSRRPIDPGHTPAAWSRNRRVQFVILRGK